MAVVALAIAAFLLFRTHRVAEPSVESSDLAENKPIVPIPNVSRPATVTSSGAFQTDTPEMTDEQRFAARMRETKNALLEKTRYPMSSRPLAMKTDLLEPHHVEPIMRGLNGNPGGNHRVAITQNQDRLLLTPGQSATVSITAMADNKPVTVTFSRSVLVPMIEDANQNAVAGSPVGNVSFHDDGVAPDTIASDGIWTGTVSTSSAAPSGGLELLVDASAEGENGTLIFNFTQVQAAPASFTQTARDVLENGSIAIYVGVSVQQAGRYEIVGRLYDANGLPIVYMRFIDEMTPDTKEVRLLAYGAVILDEGGVSPFTLKDVEGSMLVVGGFPDREPMTDWRGPYTTANYALSSLTNADNDDADKQRKIKALDKATQDGIDNVRSTKPTTPAPVGSGSH
ncbi:MAG: choice-of-anchor X domain-containing protein [Polyangiaceae bacterium]